MIVLVAHGGAVNFEFDGGRAFAGAFIVLKRSEVKAAGDGGLVIEGAGALVDDADGGLVGVQIEVAVDNCSSDGLSFLQDFGDLEVVEVKFGVAPAAEEESAADGAAAADLDGDVVFVGDAVHHHVFKTVGARGDLHQEAVVGPLFVGETAVGEKKGSVGAVAVHAVAVAVLVDKVEHEVVFRAAEAMHDLGFLEEF